MNVFKKIVLFGSVLIGTMAGIDLYFQLAEIQTPMETSLDARMGPSYIPNKRIIRFSEGFFVGAVNAYGYMGPAVPPRRIGSEKRILLLGDSYVLGHTVFPRHHFGRYLEGDLNRATGSEVHVLNFGKADSSLENLYQNYKDFAGGFDHDLALFFLAQRDLMPWEQSTARLYPAVRLKGNEIVINRDFQLGASYRFTKAIEPLFNRSAVMRLTFNTYKIIIKGEWKMVVLDKFSSVIYPGDKDTSAPIDNSHIEKLPELKRIILRELARDPRNVLVIQAPIPTGILAQVKTSGLPVIDLGTYLERQRSIGQDPYFWPVTRMRGHWNHAAQPQIGGFLAEQIITLDLLKSK